MKKLSKDRLSEMFDLQTKFNDRLVPSGMKRYLSGKADPKDANKWLLNNTRAIIHEAVEVEEACLWKWWSRDKKIDWQNLRMEVVDLWHFLLSLTMFAGMDADKLYRLYLKKLKLNHRRLDGGYSKKNKQKFSDRKIR